ncbi:MAG TPA: hypothetical protein VFC54_06735 [Pseudolabrys sp.]|nr:hypothetical protein [Pseudolabrys sp.]
MVRYTEAFIATARHGYENTDQPMRELARELGIGITTLSTLAETHGWAKRSQRQRGVPPAMQLLAEAQALATLIQAIRTLKGMRGSGRTDTGPIEDDDDDDMPRDIDEFRRDLARRIDAFVASRSDAADADGDSGPAPVDAAG